MKKFILEKPTLKKGYEDYHKGLIFHVNIPWIIMGIGSLIGLTDSPFEYAYPQLMNPIVLVYHASILILLLLFIRWIYFKNGAKFIEKHPGIIQITTFNKIKNATAKQIKAFLSIIILYVFFTLTYAWVQEVPSFITN
ncbi:hypothetical protein [uncultured Dokdonia sp.]|uniref:hypothetical protein n=1 Tax=uncultured Dokdonia sp. TaxID=575653 RepID=UPI0026216430|nr:hypothetical protein [uncultured Dokdonia sp.]